MKIRTKKQVVRFSRTEKGQKFNTKRTNHQTITNPNISNLQAQLCYLDSCIKKLQYQIQ